MIDAIDELVARSKPHKELRAFHEFHREHPEVLAFLLQEINLRLARFKAFSYHSLWEYARWKLEMDKGPSETFLMNDHAVPFYARAIAILRPDLNGRAEMRTSRADGIFGVALEPLPEKRVKGYARRLRWSDGTPLERGWRPTLTHVIDTGAHRRPDIHPKDNE